MVYHHLVSYTPLVVLLLICYQDFKSREVTWFLFPLAMLLLTLTKNPFPDMDFFVYSIIPNLLFTLFQCSVLILFFAFKGISFKTLLAKYIGLGDLLFFLVLAISLPFPFYQIFMVISLLLSALAGLIFFKEKTIPLAGIQSLVLVLCLIFNIPSSMNNYLLDLILY
tara:strand:- start:3351 stop:3851 length:501 start_codon:yes stop_codon:yes gene_type:complete